MLLAHRFAPPTRRSPRSARSSAIACAVLLRRIASGAAVMRFTGMSKTFPAAPFEGRIQPVEAQWTDYNGHLNMAYYHVLLDRAAR